MKTTVRRIRKLIQEDLYDYTGKGSTKKVAPGDTKMKKIGSSVGMLKATVERLENAVRDGDEETVANYVKRIKQFTQSIEATMYGSN